MEEVVGSIPTGSTNSGAFIRRFFAAFIRRFFAASMRRSETHPNVKAYACTPESKNSIVNVRGCTTAGWRIN